MNPYGAYQQNSGLQWTRIDMLLALFNRAVERLESAIVALRAGDELAAIPHLSGASLLVCELAAGAIPGYDGAANLLRLYEFVVHAVSQRTLEQAEAALRVLRTLRDGFEAIRPQALALERFGGIPPLDDPRLVQATA